MKTPAIIQLKNSSASRMNSPFPEHFIRISYLRGGWIIQLWYEGATRRYEIPYGSDWKPTLPEARASARALWCDLHELKTAGEEIP